MVRKIRYPHLVLESSSLSVSEVVISPEAAPLLHLVGRSSRSTSSSPTSLLGIAIAINIDSSSSDDSTPIGCSWSLHMYIKYEFMRVDVNVLLCNSDMELMYRFVPQIVGMGNNTVRQTAKEPIVGIKRVESGMTNTGKPGCGNHPVNLLSIITLYCGYIMHTCILQELD
jgi:hypothetical protein